MVGTVQDRVVILTTECGVKNRVTVTKTCVIILWDACFVVQVNIIIG